MKQSVFKISSVACFMLISIKTLAFNCEVNGITYSLSESTKEATITNSSSNDSSIVIPDKINYNNTSYDVIGIKMGAFSNCNNLTNVTIPSSITNIEIWAFKDCKNLTTLILNSNTVASQDWKNSNSCLTQVFGNQLKKVIFGEGVIKIGKYAFYSCYLTDLILPTSLSTIGDAAFKNNRFSELSLPEGITEIGSGAFSECPIKSVIIPDGVIKIGSGAFHYTHGTEHKSRQVDWIYAKRGTTALLALWEAGYTPYEQSTNKKLEPHQVTISTSQTTAIININNTYSEYTYSYAIDYTYNPYYTYYPNVFNPLEQTEFVYDDLSPEEERTIYVRAILNNTSYTSKSLIKANPISPSINAVSTSTSIHAIASYLEGDAEVISTVFSINNKTIEGDTLTLWGLDPNNEYNLSYIVNIRNKRSYNQTRTYSFSKKIKTTQLTLKTAQPKVISVGNVIVAAESNLDDEETNVGFEWRRTDWTDDFPSNTGTAVLYKGTIEGYIRNMNAEKLWKVRPYYLSNSNIYYYGDWIGIDPSNTSYFEPTVHTYNLITVEGNTALVKGYALRGTDGVKIQGFKYWKQTANIRGVDATTIPSNAMTIEATGQVMTASLTGLDYLSDYNYVAFITTTEGETFYGELQTFTTGSNLTGIKSMAEGEQAVTIVARYDTNGRKISSAKHGLNILLMSDGSFRKLWEHS